MDIVTSAKTMIRAKQVRSQIMYDNNLGKKMAITMPQFDSPDDHKIFEESINLTSIPKRDVIVVLSANTIIFEILPIHFKDQPPDLWRLVIEDDKGQRIKSFLGKGKPSEKIVWNWRREGEYLIDAGVYHYYFEWRDQDKNVYQSRKRDFFVKKFKRTINLKISHKKPYQVEKPDEVNLYLKK